MSADRKNRKQHRKAAKARFSPVSRSFWVRVGVRVEDRVTGRGWVGSTPVP